MGGQDVRGYEDLTELCKLINQKSVRIFLVLGL